MHPTTVSTLKESGDTAVYGQQRNKSHINWWLPECASVLCKAWRPFWHSHLPSP